MKVLLIAGHGGNPYDPGAIGNGYKEAILTRGLVTDIAHELSQWTGVTVFDTSQDMYKYLKSNKYDFTKYDYCLEVHFNAGIAYKEANGKVTGTEILIHPNRKQPTTLEAKILQNFAALGMTSRGIKTRTNLQNINTAQRQGAYYSLLETCFIDDADDMNLYIPNKLKFVNAIVEAFKEVFKLELTATADIVNALYERNLLTDKTLWKTKCSTNNLAYWLARKGANLTVNSLYIKSLETVNDIVWELHHRGLITDKERWLATLSQGTNLYWLAFKIANRTENKRK